MDLSLFIEDETTDADLEALEADRDARCRHGVRVDLEDCDRCLFLDELAYERRQDV